MSDFQDRWIEAARDLGIDIALDIDIVLPSTTLLCVPLLVREIGGPKGMVVVHDSGHIEKVRDELVAEGYGYSVMSGPDSSDVYDREGTIEVLQDWTWCGAQASKPDWF